jgi:hypothetical protein
MKQSEAAAALQLQELDQRWRRAFAGKAQETDRFREELEKILAVLKELRRQGVVVPL